MIEYLRADVQQWLSRSLEAYYPIIFVDAIHVKVHRKRSDENEAFYVVLGVKEDKSREVFGIFNRPSESATGWREMFMSLEHRGVKSIGLLVADGIKYLEDSLTEVFPGTLFQKCVTHLKRNMLTRVRHGDKVVMAENLRDIFRTGDPHYGWEAWQAFCGKWGEDYRGIKKLGNDPFYRYYFTYLNYHPKVQSVIYTTNWIECLQRDFRRVLRMRGAMPTEESVIVLMAKTAMGKKGLFQGIPGIERDKVLFPDDSGNFLYLLNNS